MIFFNNYRRKRAIREYMEKLPRLLAKDYGSSKIYTPKQVVRSIERYDLNVYFSCYALSMFSERAEFNSFHDENGETCDYDSMRSEVADYFFRGNSNFTVADVLEIFLEHFGGGHGGHHHSDIGTGDDHY